MALDCGVDSFHSPGSRCNRRSFAKASKSKRQSGCFRNSLTTKDALEETKERDCKGQKPGAYLGDFSSHVQTVLQSTTRVGDAAGCVGEGETGIGAGAVEEPEEEVAAGGSRTVTVSRPTVMTTVLTMRGSPATVGISTSVKERNGGRGGASTTAAMHSDGMADSWGRRGEIMAAMAARGAHTARVAVRRFASSILFPGH